MPPVAHSRCQSTYPPPACPQTSPDSAPDQTSPPADSRTPALPADSPHTAIQIVAPPGTGWCCALAEYSAPSYAPPASPPPPQLQFPAPATLPALPNVFPASRSSVPANAADYSGTSPRRTAHRSSASNVPAPLPASFSRVGLLLPMFACGARALAPEGENSAKS